MISKQSLQKYVFRNPTDWEFIFGMLTVVGIFELMIFSSMFLENELLLVGLIGGGILIGVSLSLTKNILFPIGIILIYNLSLTVIQGNIQSFTGTTYELFMGLNILQVIFRSIGDGLFISFVVYWVVFMSQSVLKFIKKLETVDDEPVTNKKFLLGSIIAGSLYGILMMIQNV